MPKWINPVDIAKVGLISVSAIILTRWVLRKLNVKQTMI